MLAHLMGKRWEMVFCKLGRQRAYGECDPPDKPGKQIRIDERLTGEARLRVIIHEMLHACDWRIDEDHIEQQASDMQRVLSRLGYANKNETPDD